MHAGLLLLLLLLLFVCLFVCLFVDCCLLFAVCCLLFVVLVFVLVVLVVCCRRRPTGGYFGLVVLRHTASLFCHQ